MARPSGFRRRIQPPIWSHRACKALQIDLSRLAAEDLSDGWLRRRLAVFLSADALIEVSAYGFLGLVSAWARWDAAALKLAYPLVVRRGPSRDGDAADSVLERGVGNRRLAVEMFSLFCGFQLVIIFAVARGLSLSWRLQPWQNGEVRGPRQRTLERAMLVVAIEMLRPVLVKKAMCPTCRSDPAIA